MASPIQDNLRAIASEPQRPERSRDIFGALQERGVVQVFLGTLLATLFALRVVGHVNKSLFLWPVSAAALGLALPFLQGGWRSRVALHIAAVAGFLIGAKSVGLPSGVSIYVAFFVCGDLVLGRLVLGPNVTTFNDLKKQANIFRFVALLVSAPILSGALGAIPIAQFLQQQTLLTAVMNVFANSLGFALVLPAALLLQNWQRLERRKIASALGWKGSLSVVFFLVVTTLTFWQTSSPFLFMVFPPMVVVLLTLGLEGAVFASIGVSLIGWIGTTHGHGPIMLMKGTSLEHLLVLQLFVWVCMVTALPIGALLDERRKADASRSQALLEKSLLAQALEVSQHLFQSFLEHDPNLAFIKNAEGQYVFYNQAFARLFGTDMTAWLGRSDHDMRPREIADTLRSVDLRVLETGQAAEIIDQAQDAEGRWRSFKAIKFAYQNLAGEKQLAGIAIDITDQIQREKDLAAANARLEEMAMIDALTGVSNRRVFEIQAAAELAFAKRKECSLSILILDIDNFKKRNDRFGHAAGDEALKVLGMVLKACVRDGDLAARIGGEEFGILLPETDAESAMNFAGRFQSMLRLAAHGPVELTVSIGVGTSDAATTNWESLVSEADDAMYAAKQSGKDRAIHHNGHSPHRLLRMPEQLVAAV